VAYKIIATCTACDACLPACPIDAISAGDPIYVIDQELCCDFEDCLAVCPVEAIVPAHPQPGGLTPPAPRALDPGVEAAAGPGQSGGRG
jgi:ferredoxin